MAAILMTSLFGPDAELRWGLKLLQIPQSLILYRSPKIVTKFTRDHFFGPFDIDYFGGAIFNASKLRMHNYGSLGIYLRIKMTTKNINVVKIG